MSFVAAFVLAAVAARPAPADARREPDRGAEIETARVSVTILRSAALSGATLASNERADAPHSQRHAEGARVTYAFE